jgi:hypothetical protein
MALVALVAMFVAGSAAAARNRKLVEGTVYDTTCATLCAPECPPPPHCGPITDRAVDAVVCAQARRLIVCPLAAAPRIASPAICLQGSPCGGGAYPVYSGEGGVVTARRRAYTEPSVTIPVVEGHFQRRLGPGEWVFRIYLAERDCWNGEPVALHITPKQGSPIPLPFDVRDDCVAHPDTP